LPEQRALGLSRRSLLRSAVVAGLGVPLLSGSGGPLGRRPGRITSPSGAAGGPRTGDPVTLAMHLHSSFSEGVASMAAHLEQARRLGVDVLFWTDHDFRVSAQGHRRRLGLTGWTDREHGVDLTWRQWVDGAVAVSDVSFVPDKDGPAAVLTVQAAAVEVAATLWLEAEAWNFTYSGSLADTSLELEAEPLTVGPDAHLVLELDLSHHPASGGRAAGRYRVGYRVGPFAGTERVARGRDGIVHVPAPVGRWSTLMLRPADDVRALWPDLIAEDNSIQHVRVGVAARRGATARCAVRHVSFLRARRGGQESLALMREVMGRYVDRYPDRRQYAALEVSLVRHLNWFGADLVMPDYGVRAPIKDDSVPAAAAMVEFIHRHRGLASYNHPLAGHKEAVARHMVETAALGADIVEIAYAGPDVLDSMLYVFDACARNLVFVTGNGVTDDHDGIDWYANRKSNWITAAWAGSVELPDLMAALRAGRAWCYKPDGWAGALDVRVAGAPAMGGVLVTPRPVVPVTVQATDLPADGSLEIVTGLADRAAATPATTSVVVPVRRVPSGGYPLDARPGDGTYLRVTVRDAGGAVVGVGNPIWLLPRAPAGGVPRARALTDG